MPIQILSLVPTSDVSCELILETPGRERSQSDQEEAGSPPFFMYEMFQVVPISKKVIW